MTQHLLDIGAPVHAIELVRRFLPGLSPSRKTIPQPGSRSRRHSRSEHRRDRFRGRRSEIYGNVSYFITSPILHHLFTFADIIDEIHVVIQTKLRFASPLSPARAINGYLSVVTQFYTRPEFSSKFRAKASIRLRSHSALVTLRLPGERASSPSPPAFHRSRRASRLFSDGHSLFLDFVKLCSRRSARRSSIICFAVSRSSRTRIGVREDALHLPRTSVLRFCEKHNFSKIRKRESASRDESACAPAAVDVEVKGELCVRRADAA